MHEPRGDAPDGRRPILQGLRAACLILAAAFLAVAVSIGCEGSVFGLVGPAALIVAAVLGLSAVGLTVGLLIGDAPWRLLYLLLLIVYMVISMPGGT